ncbi:MAG: 3'-5' exonuclease [Deltaproteobacteria bacterium]|nr:3'-5' exonuclease [Deltaproteobacteria bacterium]
MAAVGAPPQAERFVAIDVETTGLSPRAGHRVIEIGAVAIEEGHIVGEFATLIDAGVSVPYAVQAIHGITDAMLAGQPRPEEALPLFSRFIRESTLIAHNAPFDLRFLRHEFARLGLGLPHPHRCTLALSRHRLPRLADHSLETVYRHLFPEADFLRQSHRALEDARLAAKIWLKLGGG